MKKTIFILAIAVLVMSVTGITTFAHGGHGNRQQTRYELCQVDDCDELGQHQHDGVCYRSAGNGAGYGCERR